MLDSLHHIAYCIINKTALERQQNNRDREKPGYIQALLKLLNQGLTPSEPSLFPQTNEELFSKETCQAEFDKMFNNNENAEILKESRLIIVEYTAPHGHLRQISALLLNQSFEIVKNSILINISIMNLTTRKTTMFQIYLHHMKNLLILR